MWPMTAIDVPSESILSLCHFCKETTVVLTRAQRRFWRKRTARLSSSLVLGSHIQGLAEAKYRVRNSILLPPALHCIGSCSFTVTWKGWSLSLVQASDPISTVLIQSAEAMVRTQDKYTEDP